MHATSSTLAKASRLPLTSKQASKNFYKGTRAANVLKRIRVGYPSLPSSSSHGSRGGLSVSQHRALALTPRVDQQTGVEKSWSKRAGGRLDEARMISFVVPPGLERTKVRPLSLSLDSFSTDVGASPCASVQLRPYVFTGTSDKGGLPERPRPGYPTPSSSTSSTNAENVHWGPGPMSGQFYTSLITPIEERRARRYAVERDVGRMRSGRKA